MKQRLKVGTRLRSITTVSGRYYNLGGYTAIDQPPVFMVTNIEVVDVVGQMAYVPWAEVFFSNDVEPLLVNLAFCQEVVEL